MINIKQIIKTYLKENKDFLKKYHLHEEKSCSCGCNTCENVGNLGPILQENLQSPPSISNNLKYHIDGKKPLTENTFRYGSNAFLNFWKEARELYNNNYIYLSEVDKEIINETDLGKHGIFRGNRVPLDLPIIYEDQYEPIIEDIRVYGKIYESVNIENSYSIVDIISDGVSNSFIFTDKHGIKRKLQIFKGNSIKLLWLNPSTNSWTTDDIPSKYEDEKVMNTFGKILIKVILPKYNSFNFQALNTARYRLFRALLYNNLDTSKYEMDYNDEDRSIEVYKIENLTEETKKKNPPLNKPKRGGSKKFYVYVRDPKTKRIKKVSFGDTGGLKAKINNPKARKAFAARHKCGTGEPKTSARYWSCRLPRFSKLLGLKSSFSGFW